jgi:hypothetical protein
MAELSTPIMTPLGLVYRIFFGSNDEALKFAEWAKGILGGVASPVSVFGPGPKGRYEAGLLATVPKGAKCLKRRKGVSEAWMKTPEPAYVLFNEKETPIALYFHERELLFMLQDGKPITAYSAVPTR